MDGFTFLFSKFLKKCIEKIKEIILLSLSVNIILIPIMLYHFNTLSLTFLISNILASPLLGIIIILGFISIIISFVFFPLAKTICIPLKIALKIFFNIAKCVGNFPFSQVYLPTPKIYLIIIYYLLITIIMFYRKIKKKTHKRKIQKSILNKLKKITFKKLIIIISIILILLLLYKQIPKKLNIYFIDVGQGDSTLIVTPQNKKILIDGGGSRDRQEYDVGKNVLLPYLLDKGIVKLDYIIVSHFDSDHATGCAYIMEKLTVCNIVLTKQLEENDLYKQIVNIAIKRNINLIYVKAGDRLEIDGVTMRVLHPTKELIEENSTNNNSIVCRLEYNSFSMLFTGDIEEIAEEKILNKYKNNLTLLKATVLKVGHHGSKTSSTDDFIKAVKPTIALIGVGKNNKFGHPNDSVLQKFKENRTRTYRTDENGEISITVNKKGEIINIKTLV